MKTVAISNPFPLTGYYGPEYFCDREQECMAILRAVTSGVNVSLVSLRRMGKTAMMRHIMHVRTKKAQPTILVDVHPTSDISGLIEVLAQVVITDLYSMGKRLTVSVQEFIGRLGATLSIASDGTPSVTLAVSQNARKHAHTLKVVLNEIESWKKPVLVIFDEFQQVEKYPEDNAEAVLRAAIQPLTLTRFVFSGSQRGMLDSMFQDHRRPFYASTQHVYLGPIDPAAYAKYVRSWLATKHRHVSDVAVAHLYSECAGRTFHMQQVMNRLWDDGVQRIDVQDVDRIIHDIHREQEHLYYRFRSLLTNAQWRLLQALASAEVVRAPLSHTFRTTYAQPAASTVRRALDALVDRELVAYADGAYFVEDPFLSSWIRATFA